MQPIWYEELGFSFNPFTIKPVYVNDELVGQAEQIDAICSFITKGGLGAIIGKYGVGKTTILQGVISTFAGKKKVVYFSCNRLRGALNIDKLLHERYGVIGRIFKIKSKNMILLLDEADNLTEKDIDTVHDYIEKKYFKSVLFVTPHFENLKISDKIKKHFKDTQFPLTPLSTENAIELVKKRLGKITFISDTVIGQIHSMSDSPRVFLKNCEDVCRYSFNQKHKRVTKKDVREALA